MFRFRIKMEERIPSGAIWQESLTIKVTAEKHCDTSSFQSTARNLYLLEFLIPENYKMLAIFHVNLDTVKSKGQAPLIELLNGSGTGFLSLFFQILDQKLKFSQEIMCMKYYLSRWSVCMVNYKIFCSVSFSC